MAYRLNFILLILCFYTSAESSAQQQKNLFENQISATPIAEVLPYVLQKIKNDLNYKNIKTDDMEKQYTLLVPSTVATNPTTQHTIAGDIPKENDHNIFRGDVPSAKTEPDNNWRYGQLDDRVYDYHRNSLLNYNSHNPMNGQAAALHPDLLICLNLGILSYILHGVFGLLNRLTAGIIPTAMPYALNGEYGFLRRMTTDAF